MAVALIAGGYCWLVYQFGWWGMAAVAGHAVILLAAARR
jgi:hypothetical protein